MKPTKASMKNAESSDSPQYFKIPKAQTFEPKSQPHTVSKKPLKTALRYDLSKESPFNRSSPSENLVQNTSNENKSSYNILKDNQEYKIGEDPNKRSEFFIRTKLPALEVYK